MDDQHIGPADRPRDLIRIGPIAQPRVMLREELAEVLRRSHRIAQPDQVHVIIAEEVRERRRVRLRGRVPR